MRERATRKLVLDKQRLAALEPGGAADRPIEVSSSAVIPVRARSQRCPLCGGSLLLDEETATMIDGKSLRTAHLTCQQCGVRRELWFRIGSPLPN